MPIKNTRTQTFTLILKEREHLGRPVCAIQEQGTASVQSLCWSSSIAATGSGGFGDLLDRACEWQGVFPDGELEHSARQCL